MKPHANLIEPTSPRSCRLPLAPRLRVWARLASSFGFAVLTAGASLAQTAAAPEAAPRLAGERGAAGADDPYRHFENKADPEIAKWMKAQNEHARATLAAIPGRGAILENLKRYDASVTDRVTQVRRAPGEIYFMQRRDAADTQFKLLMRQGLGGKEKVLIDPVALEKRTGKAHSVNWFSASPDASMVAFGMSRKGTEGAMMSVLNTRGGRTLGAPIARAELGGVDWTPDGKALVFNRLQTPPKGMPEAQKFHNSQTYLLRLGAPPASARPVFGNAIKGLEIGPADVPSVKLTHDGRWAIGTVTNSARRELGVFLMPQRSLLAGKSQWQRILSSSDAVTSAAYFGNTLYLVSHKGAPRAKLLALNLDAPDTAARELVAESDRVILHVAAAADALYIEARDGNLKRLYKRSYRSAANLVEVALPVQGSFELGGERATAADPHLPGVVIELQGWTQARQWYQVAGDASVSNTGLQPAGPFDAPADIVATEVKVRSHDDTLVPLSLIHRKGIPLDGKHPTLLYAYAAYGATEKPFFSSSRLAWLDAGGIVAVANPRGSGVYGPDWYKAGFQASKPNSWKDFIACAEYLIAARFTEPSRLAAMGNGAGAILVGRALTERPELFAAAVSASGGLDALRFEVTPHGAHSVAEFGSAKTEAGHKALLAMSTYAHIKNNTAYPAVLLTHAVNDARVEVWHSTKTAARLSAATTSDRPVLLRLDYATGPGGVSSKAQQLEERADLYSFLLWQMGAKTFQP